ncbi:MAG: 50S ribosomal protein L17 [Candidatus Levybacteria bacterium]|nr:50S ribosomal protein L17 [Candidatus Levybacteria bacterium]
MKKNVFGRKFKRDVNERKALFKGLMSQLVLHGRIRTTEPKAKAIRSSADKLITKARKNKLLAKKLLSVDLIPAAVDKLLNDVVKRFNGRSGGYTRLIKLGKRFNDNAEMVIMEWVEGEKAIVKEKQGKEEKKEIKTQRGQPRKKKGEKLEQEVKTKKPKIAKIKRPKKAIKNEK